ncbi:efflux RND transporter permease subunit [Oceanicoccus sp. KOV_DT_Chl]|uniref:efflux RND transporter permease subunit n=1 Tax=Oceanicoccus sp. KOV_DT_Chl TaxID=1904639 RepID=UPI002101660B|nr:efflux RND transporter permease subunit [Oceanicoccus sp. KOV_DT_Chl]
MDESMRFTDIFIRRPVLAIVLSLFLLLIGLKAFTSLQLRQYPEIVYPTINITTAYPGASASLIKGFITTPILNAITSVEGIDYVTAQSNESVSSVTVYLNQDYPVDTALLDLTTKINKIRSELPTESEAPLVEKMEGLGSDTLQYIAFSSATMSEEQITDYLSKVVLPQLSTVEGMGRLIFVVSALLRCGCGWMQRKWLPIKLLPMILILRYVKLISRALPVKRMTN